jgi:hypothetical protein
MGTGVRVFFVAEDDSLIKVSVARWDRLHNNHPAECFHHYAGKKVRYILAFLEMEDRKPVQFTYTECGYIFFDSEGKLDEEEWHKQLQLAGQGMSLLDIREEKSNVINASGRFAQKTYHIKYKWEMSSVLLNKMVCAVFP